MGGLSTLATVIRSGEKNKPRTTATTATTTNLWLRSNRLGSVAVSMVFFHFFFHRKGLFFVSNFRCSPPGRGQTLGSCTIAASCTTPAGFSQLNPIHSQSRTIQIRIRWGRRRRIFFSFPTRDQKTKKKEHPIGRLSLARVLAADRCDRLTNHVICNWRHLNFHRLPFPTSEPVAWNGKWERGTRSRRTRTAFPHHQFCSKQNAAKEYFVLILINDCEHRRIIGSDWINGHLYGMGREKRKWWLVWVLSNFIGYKKKDIWRKGIQKVLFIPLQLDSIFVSGVYGV